MAYGINWKLSRRESPMMFQAKGLQSVKGTRGGSEARYFLEIPSLCSDFVELDQKLPSQDYRSASGFKRLASVNTEEQQYTKSENKVGRNDGGTDTYN